MNGFNVTYSVKDFFLDRSQIQKRIGIAQARALGRQGSYVRTRARTDVLKRRKSISAPGQPPNTHSPGSRSLKSILYFYDPRSQSVVIGPVKFNQVNQSTRGRISIPQLHEFGGTVGIREVEVRPGVWFRMDLRRRRANSGKRKRVRNAKYPARPFMSVALDREIKAGTIADSWRNVVRGD